MGERRRIVVLVEGPDGAGKTSLVRALATRFAGASTLAMPRPTETELRGFYFGRYLERLHGSPGVVLCDRSWYSRAGVERVMGFCSARELEQFFDAVPRVEAELVRSGIALVKIYLDVSDAEQERRILRRAAPTSLDLAALCRTGEHRAAAAESRLRTSTPIAPWHVLGSGGDPTETTALAYARITAANGERGVALPCTERSCSSAFVSSTSEEGNFGSRS